VSVALALERTFESTFCVGDRLLCLKTNDATIDEYLRRCYRRLVAASPVASVTGHDEGALLWDGNGLELWFDGLRLGERRRFEDVLAAAVWGSAKLLGMTLRRLNRCRAYYATGAVHGDACVAIAAPSATGKTTLALELLRRNWATYGDEFLLLDRRTLVVEGVPLAFMVRESSFELLDDPLLERRVRAGTMWSGAAPARTWYDFDVQEAFGYGAVATPRALTHLVLLERSSDGLSSLETISPAAATLELLPNLFVECLRIADVWEAVERFERVACYRLFATDHRTAADMLENLVGIRSCS